MVDALRALHAALVPGGVVVDTQPVSPHPGVDGAGGELGLLDLREWAELIRAIDAGVDAAVAQGLFSVTHESQFVVTDDYDDGAEFVDAASQWAGTRIPAALERRAAQERGTVSVHQQVRMRLLRRT